MLTLQGHRKRCGQYYHGRTIISQNKIKTHLNSQTNSLKSITVTLQSDHLERAVSNYTWRDCATSQAHFVLGKNVSIMWFRCEHFENKPGASFEPIHVAAMMQWSHVDKPLTSRKISFAGRFAVAGTSEEKTQRRIDSFRFLLPPAMTVEEETSDGLAATTE